jgi:hypothetical protein
VKRAPSPTPNFKHKQAPHSLTVFSFLGLYRLFERLDQGLVSTSALQMSTEDMTVPHYGQPLYELKDNQRLGLKGQPKTLQLFGLLERLADCLNFFEVARIITVVTVVKARHTIPFIRLIRVIRIMRGSRG